jgi:hypothetical protein
LPTSSGVPVMVAFSGLADGIFRNFVDAVAVDDIDRMFLYSMKVQGEFSKALESYADCMLEYNKNKANNG